MLNINSIFFTINLIVGYFPIKGINLYYMLLKIYVLYLGTLK